MNGLRGNEDNQHNQICCLIDGIDKCTRSAGNAAYNKRIQRLVSQRKLRLHSDPMASHNYICNYHKGVIQSVRGRRKRPNSDDEFCDIEEHPEVELYNLQLNTLRRYKRHYKLSTNPTMSKAELSDVITKHFHTIPVAEKECLTYFIYLIKSNNSKLDQKNWSSTSNT